MNEKVTCEDAQEMARRQDEDYIESLKMIGEGAPNFINAEEEREQLQCKIENN